MVGKMKGADRIEELEWLRDALVKKVQGLTNLLDDQFGTPCEQIRHKQEIEALTEQLEAARADAKEAEAYAEEVEAMNKNQEAMIRQADRRGDALEAKLAQAVEALQAVYQHEASIFYGPDAEKNRRAGWRGVFRKVKTALAEIGGEKG
jgi:chromosome segregation ATPase